MKRSKRDTGRPEEKVCISFTLIIIIGKSGQAQCPMQSHLWEKVVLLNVFWDCVHLYLGLKRNLIVQSTDLNAELNPYPSVLNPQKFVFLVSVIFKLQNIY